MAARSGLRALPTLCASAVKDWSRSFWSAVLQHRFCFGSRADFHVGLSLVLRPGGARAVSTKPDLW